MGYNKQFRNYGKRICLTCGKEFEATTAPQIFCSKECKLEDKRRYQVKQQRKYKYSDIDWLNCRYEEALEKIRELETRLNG